MLAMATGTLPLGFNPPELSESIPALSLSPVIHTEINSLLERLNSLIDEPKSISDLSVRCSNYVNLNLRLEIAATETKEIYQKLLA